MAEEDNPKEVTVAAVAAETSDEFVQDAVPEKIDANDAEQTESNGQLEVASGDVDNGKTAAELLEEDIPWIERFKQVFWTYLPLGFVAFGGPQAHVAILRDHLVVQRNWLDEDQFTELFAIGQGYVRQRLYISCAQCSVDMLTNHHLFCICSERKASWAHIYSVGRQYCFG